MSTDPAPDTRCSSARRRSRRAAASTAGRSAASWARRSGDQPEDVHVLVADVLATAWRRRRDVPPEALAWPYGVARHVLADGHRRRARQRRLTRRSSTARHEPGRGPGPPVDSATRSTGPWCPFPRPTGRCCARPPGKTSRRRSSRWPRTAPARRWSQGARGTARPPPGPLTSSGPCAGAIPASATGGAAATAPLDVRAERDLAAPTTAAGPSSVCRGGTPGRRPRGSGGCAPRQTSGNTRCPRALAPVVAKDGMTLLARMERRLMHLFGPADVRAADSRRPAPLVPPAATGPVIIGEFERPEDPRA